MHKKIPRFQEVHRGPGNEEIIYLRVKNNFVNQSICDLFIYTRKAVANNNKQKICKKIISQPLVFSLQFRINMSC